MVKRHESPKSRRQIVAGFEQSQPGSANSGYKKYYQNPDNQFGYTMNGGMEQRLGTASGGVAKIG